MAEKKTKKGLKIFFETNFKETEIGKIPKDWEVKEIGEIGKISMCKRVFKYETESTGEIPFYKIKTFGKNADAFISKELFKKYKNKYSYPKKEDILLSTSGTIGRIVKFNGEDSYFQDSNIVWIKHNEEKIKNDFLFYIYKITNWTTEGSTIKRLYNNNLNKTKLPLPSLSEQKAIAKVLSDLDEKIEINKKQNEILEEIGKTIFKRWFVDFEFDNYKSNGGEMVYSEELEKEIPQGWEVGRLGDYFFEVKEKTNSENFEPFSIGVKGCIPRNKIYKKSISKSLKNNKIIQKGDLIFGLGTNKVVYGFMKENSGCVSNAYFVFRLQNLGNFGFFENIFSCFKNFFDNILKPTARQGQTIEPEMFFNNFMYIPPKNILEKFNQQAERISQTIYNNHLENQSLQNIRDYLLPKLMKGEIRIK